MKRKEFKGVGRRLAAVGMTLAMTMGILGGSLTASMEVQAEEQ